MSVASEINRIIEAKNNIKSAILQKGGTITDQDSLDNYAQGVMSIPSGGQPVIPEILDTDPLTFVCVYQYDDGGSWLSLDKFGNAPEKTFEYNKNDSGWQSYTENTHIHMVVGDYVQFRSSSTTSMGSSTTDYRNFKTNGIFKCLGSVMSLFNNVQNFSSSQTYACIYLFNNCHITSAPALQSINVYAYSYFRMFNGCSLLMNAPALPATTLANYCYQYMFAGCTSLTTAPSILPATTLQTYCYSYMFNDCASLVNAPALPATTLSNYCYQYMFNGCKSLVNAPALPATTLADYCYNQMFRGCSSLTTAPALPATTLKSYCYYSMFQNCTSLVNAPALPATTLTTYCYGNMFQNCTSLVNAPSILPATTLQTYCYYYMFDGCKSLTTAPVLPATTLKSDCYSYMFQNCSKLNYVKAMFTTTPSTSYTRSWLSGVASSGTFVKNSAATWTTTGVNAVPTGWTVERASA